MGLHEAKLATAYVKHRWVQDDGGRAHYFDGWDAWDVVTACGARIHWTPQTFIKEPKGHQPWCRACTDKEDA